MTFSDAFRLLNADVQRKNLVCLVLWGVPNKLTKSQIQEKSASMKGFFNFFFHLID